MSMEIQGMAVLGQPIPPRPPKPPPPSVAELRDRVATAEAELRAAQGAEAALLDERQDLKAEQKALEQAWKALGPQRLTPRERTQQEAALREQRDELRELDWNLTQRQHAARLRAGTAAEALQRAIRALGRRGQED